MQLLKDRIRRDGQVFPGNVLKVDSFLNHQMDIGLFEKFGKEFKRRFEGEEINKILTIEASGIGIACIVAQSFGVPVVFAKKSQSKNIAGEVYSSQVQSYTHGRIYDIIVSKKFLGPEDKVLIIDDFMANGAAMDGLLEVIRESGACPAKETELSAVYEKIKGEIPKKSATDSTLCWMWCWNVT